ncbi:UNVERIFIED_CONTAM: putative xyloglucan endotransglucosylase/hydrolase protein 30 [Sesamum latifolium]|uniref:Xyloglucan endotransglucosylase/hydrolase protein 30 n=1 Tax=Sesamum latifolium TaxID=2727402 RepID=A0AAW2YFD7_9LAMI
MMEKLQFHSLHPPIMIMIIIINIIFLLLHVSSSFAAPHHHHHAPSVFNISTIPFTTGFSPLFVSSKFLLWGFIGIVRLRLKSSDLYNHGLFSAKIKLPSDYTAGIVVAFYENARRTGLRVLGEHKRKKHGGFRQTCMGMEAQNRGREERYYLWFDPSKEFHTYSILWTTKNIIFYIDDVPIREIVRNDAMGADFPSKPMGLYATIWDASDWATSGGKYRANYKYAPFVAEFTDLILHGCPMDPLEEVVASVCAERDNQLASADFAMPLSECVVDPVERQLFKNTGRLKFDEKHRRRRVKKRGQVMGARDYGNQEEE